MTIARRDPNDEDLEEASLLEGPASRTGQAKTEPASRTKWCPIAIAFALGLLVARLLLSHAPTNTSTNTDTDTDTDPVTDQSPRPGRDPVSPSALAPCPELHARPELPGGAELRPMLTCTNTDTDPGTTDQ
jgi:hypothetical protein